MQVLTPFEFISVFPEDSTVVFVGNAPSLIGEGLGEWIDSHDVVVRFNECPTRDYEDDVGSRTDILVSNPYPEGRSRTTLLDNNQGVVFIIAPQTRRGDYEQFSEWLGSNQVFFTYAPDLIQIGDVDHKASLTTGTYGLHLLTRLLMPKKVSITGFTMFLENTSFHYFRAEAPKGLHAHDLEVEANIFIRICNSLRSSVEVTSEIDWVANISGAKLSPEIQIRMLKDQRWKK